MVAETIEGLPEAMSANSADADGGRSSEPLQTPIPFSMVGFEVPDGAELWFRTSADGDDWSEWIHAPALTDEDGPDSGTSEHSDAEEWTQMTDAVWVGEAQWLQTGVFGGAPAEVTAHLIDAHGLSASVSQKITSTLKSLFSSTGSVANALPNRPAILSRAQWGANESYAGSPSYASRVVGGVVHHTANSNNYTKAEAPGIVRGIYHYHTRTLGWKDVGYNILIDRYGTIYEGRKGGVERGVIGAHAQGFNTGTFGVSIIGDFRNVAPPTAALNSLTAVLAWKSSIHGLNPTSSITFTSGGSNKYSSGTKVNLPTIFAHSDVGLTSCPGAAFYRLLPGLRAAAGKNLPVASLTGPSNNATVSGPVSISAQASVPTGNIDYVVWFVDGQWIGNDYTAPYSMSWNSVSVPNGVRDLAVVAVSDKGYKSTSRVNIRVDNGSAPHSRVGGTDGIHTAVRVSQTALDSQSAKRAVLVRDDLYADAIAGGPLAGGEGPVLLTNGVALDSRVRAELERVLPAGRTVYVLGGRSAVSNNVIAALSDRWTVKRVAGSNREETAALVADLVVKRTGTTRAMVARSGGDDAAWADGLAAGAYGAQAGVPVLLTKSDSLSSAAKAAINRLGIKKTIVLGGPSAVSNSVLAALPSSRRVFGSNRAATAAAIAADSELWGGGEAALIADGYRVNGWKDALVAAPLAALHNAPVLLVGPTVPSQTSDALRAIRAAKGQAVPAWVLGGEAAVSAAAAEAALRLLR